MTEQQKKGRRGGEEEEFRLRINSAWGPPYHECAALPARERRTEAMYLMRLGSILKAHLRAGGSAAFLGPGAQALAAPLARESAAPVPPAGLEVLGGMPGIDD